MLRLSPRRPVGVLGLWYRSPGASRAASPRAWVACDGASTHIHHLSQPPYAWRPCPLNRPALAGSCVCSGLASELAHAALLLAWSSTTAEPPNLPSHQPLVMISL